MTLTLPDWPPDWPEIRQAVDDSMRSGDWGRYHSRSCAALEKRLADQYDVPLARVCCSGTAALEIALRALQLAAGDEVILAAYDYPGNFRTVELAGGRPVLVDVRPQNASLDPRQLGEAASPSVSAVIATHLYGQPADIESVRSICDENDWVLIEDACQVIGMSIDGGKAGTFGDLATLSFGGSKLISAGGGGALLVRSERLAARIGPLLDRPGEVFPLSPLQSAVIGPQLDRLDELNVRRAANVAWLMDHRRELPRWTPIESARPGVSAAHYKLAFLAESAEHRAEMIDAAEKLSLPIGPGFRSASRCSPRRCRKPVETKHAEIFQHQLFVLDQRALLVSDDQREPLFNALKRIHDIS